MQIDAREREREIRWRISIHIGLQEGISAALVPSHAAERARSSSYSSISSPRPLERISPAPSAAFAARIYPRSTRACFAEAMTVKGRLSRFCHVPQST
jgi:hypothetical protein